MMNTVYLDFAATTPVDPSVAQGMHDCLLFDGNFGNPASRTHGFGWRAESAVESARRQVADLISCDPREIVWSSGATESNNLAIKGAVEAKNRACQRESSLVNQVSDFQPHVLTSQIEHKAVLDPCQYLASNGCVVSYLAPSASGRITHEAVLEGLRDNTQLVSIMFVNNETGVINDIEAIGKLCRERNILFHVDAAQAAGKIPIDVNALNIDLLSISAHKMYGPKGVGALYVRRAPEVNIEAQIHGGGHERGMRSGTLPTHQLVGMGLAAQLAQSLMSDDFKHLNALREQFLSGLNGRKDIRINGETCHYFPGILNIEFLHIDGETLLMSLRELAISSGSACTSASVEPSYVLKAMGLSARSAHNSLRFSFGRTTTFADIDLAVDRILSALKSLSF